MYKLDHGQIKDLQCLADTVLSFLSKGTEGGRKDLTVNPTSITLYTEEHRVGLNTLSVPRAEWFGR